jgi:subtilisin-like proprotein convertase family protein
VDKLPQYGNVKWGGRLDLAAALADVALTPPPVSGVHPAITGTISSKPSLGQFYKVRVIFNEAVIPSSFTTANVTLNGPNGGIGVSGVTAVSGTSNTQFDITFATQTGSGTYHLTVGPHIQDAAGHEMVQAFTTSSTVRGSATSFSAGSGSLNLAIRDFHTTTSTINVGQGMAIGKMTVGVNITHSWVGDLVIKLRGPDGTTVTLFNRRGGNGHNIRTTFDDGAAKSLSNARAPYLGSVRPDDPLSAFKGKSTQGAWQLIVQDQAAGNEGTLTSWTLTFQPGTSTQSARQSGIEDAAPVTDTPALVAQVDAIFARSLVSFLAASENPPKSLPVGQVSAGHGPATDTPVPTLTQVQALDRLFAADGGCVAPELDIAWEGFVADTDAELAGI